MSYFDEKGIIRLTKEGEHPVENTPLFHITYLMQKGSYTERAFKQVEELYLRDIAIGAESHDNMTAFITYFTIVRDMNVFYSKRARQYILAIRALPLYKHPRDILYIHYLQGKKYTRILAIPVFITLLIIFLYMAVKKYKIRGERKIFKTDTEILYGLRLMLPKQYKIIHLTKHLVVPLLERKYGKNWFKKCMDIYYKEEEHPNRAF